MTSLKTQAQTTTISATTTQQHQNQYSRWAKKCKKEYNSWEWKNQVFDMIMNMLK